MTIANTASANSIMPPKPIMPLPENPTFWVQPNEDIAPVTPVKNQQFVYQDYPQQLIKVLKQRGFKQVDQGYNVTVSTAYLANLTDEIAIQPLDNNDYQITDYKTPWLYIKTYQQNDKAVGMQIVQILNDEQVLKDVGYESPEGTLPQQMQQHSQKLTCIKNTAPLYGVIYQAIFDYLEKPEQSVDIEDYVDERMQLKVEQSGGICN